MKIVVLMLVVIMGLMILVNEVRLRRQERWVDSILVDKSCSEAKLACSEDSEK